MVDTPPKGNINWYVPKPEDVNRTPMPGVLEALARSRADLESNLVLKDKTSAPTDASPRFDFNPITDGKTPE